MARPNEFKLTNDSQLEICELHRKGMSIKDLRVKYNIGNATLYRYLKRGNVTEPRCRKDYNFNLNPKIYRLYNFNEKYFDIIDTQERAYFLGFLYADGYNNIKQGRIQIALQWRDFDILEKLQNNLKSNYIINCNIFNGFKQCFLSINSRYLSNQLTKLGMLHKKSLILKFPTEDQVPKHLIRHFIRGYFDGDGCFGEYTRRGNQIPKIFVIH